MSNFSFSPIYLTLYSYTFVLKSGSIFKSSIFKLESPSPIFSFASVVVSSVCAVVAVSSFFPSLVISIVYVFLVPFLNVTTALTDVVPFFTVFAVAIILFVVFFGFVSIFLFFVTSFFLL